MLITLKHKPSVFEGVAVRSPVYLRGQNSEGIYGYMLLNFNEDKCSVHMSVLRWGASVLKDMKKDWEQVRALCRKRGCVKLFAINQSENDKWYRFIGHFGFVDYAELRMYHQEV